MARRVTLQDIAEHAGVGVATVDRVLNGRARVKPATAQRVLASAEALGHHARGLMRRRVEEMASPPRILGFILQKRGKWFYRNLARAIQDAAADMHGAPVRILVEFVESLSPGDLVEEIERMRTRADAMAIVAVDHPRIHAEIAGCRERNIPVFALLSPLNSPDMAGFIGIDGRRAGRTAGWAMSRFSRLSGEVGILIGSYRYVGQEDRETGFRGYMREFAPRVRLRDSIVYLDDAAVAYEAASELLRSAPDLAGLYHCGGGVEGAIRALAESGLERKPFYICHENGPAVLQGLVEGEVDLAIVSPVREIATRTLQAMADHLAGAGTGNRNIVLPFALLTPENISPVPS